MGPASGSAAPVAVAPSTGTPLTIERTSIIILFLLLFALATRIPLDTDTWWHLRAGQWMVEHGQIISGDPFSHTAAGVVRVPADWLSQVVLYGIWALAGNFGLALFTSTLATAGMATLFRASDGSAYLKAFLMILGAATAAVFWSARPQMFTFFLSGLLIYLIALYKRREIDRLWWIIPLMWIWGNLHGGYFIGLLLLYGTLTGEVVNHLLPRVLPFMQPAPHRIELPRLRKLALVTVLSTAVLLINPAGLRLLLLPFETFTLGPLRQYIQEWNPPDFTQPFIFPFVGLLVLTIIALITSWRKLDWSEALLVGGSGYLAVTAARNLSFFAVVAIPVLSYHLNAWFERRGWVIQTIKRPTWRQIRLNRVLICVIGVVALAKVLLVLDTKLGDAAMNGIFPVKAVTYLNQAHPDGKMFNSYNWGGYLMYNAPDYPVYIDGRTDLYGDFVLEYVKIAFAQDGWQEAIDSQGINLVVVETGSPLAKQLLTDPAWETAYTDELASVFTRRDYSA
ncbi:MAG TPA: hypothetical protein VHL11_10480 [Phototrophicaceae bacterium]|jgi:hypothetical protein|nr:hypothetical protein [Phototrophicaceae bacterium]